MSLLARIEGAISFDEIGVASAAAGGLVLRSAYQFIFARRNGELRAVAAEGFLRPFRDGAPAELDPDTQERAFLRQLGVALHLLNYRHIGVDGIDLVIDQPDDPRIAGIFAGRAPILPGEAGFDVSRLVHRVREPETPAQGARVVLAAPAGGPPPLSGIRRFAPQTVRIDEHWFRRMAANEATLRLLPRLVAAIRAHGTNVLIGGIGTRGELAAALDAGADYVQGDLLSRPQAAGSFVDDEAAISLTHLLREDARVIPLFGGR